MLVALLQGAPESYQQASVGRVQVLAASRHMALGIALGEQADRVAVWPGLGRQDPGPVRLVVASDGSALGRVGRGQVPSWGVGLAIPGARTIVVRADAPDPYGALRHELAHLALHQAVKVRMPLWFDEGYAVYAAGEFDRMEALRLNLAVVRGAIGDLRTLDRALRQGEAEATTAYALAGSTVHLLARLHPAGTLDAMVGRLAAGEPFDSAVVATTGYTVAGFERAWQRDLRRRFGWYVWLGAGGGWFILALLVIAAVRWRRQRDLPRRLALNEGWIVEEDEDPRPRVED
jgi:hypothetical protein